MIAAKLAGVLQPLIAGAILMLGRFSKLVGLGIVKLATWLITDFATVAGAGAIVWGIHFFSVPAAWISAGVMTLLLISVGVKPIR